MSKELVEIKIPKAMAERIRKQPRFKLYRDLDDFVADAIRRLIESYREEENHE